jgi:microcystin-dependent protein
VSEPFLGEVKIISWNYAPRGWAFCNGQLMSIQQNAALFSVIGTAYGGNGVQTFGLPNLQGRSPVHAGGPLGGVIGTAGGEEFHTLLYSEMPVHIHSFVGATQAGTVAIPPGNFVAQTSTQAYHTPTNLQPMNSGSIGASGGNQPHENRQPFLVLNFVIALSGIFPSRN